MAPPGGLPAAFLEDVPDALSRLVRRYASSHGPFTVDDLRARYGVDCTRRAERARARRRRSCAASSGPAGASASGAIPRCSAALRRASLAVLRKEVEPVDQRALARFTPAWQNVDRHPPTGAGVDRLREALVPFQALALPAEVWERDVLPRRLGAYSPTWMDQLCASRRGRVDRRRRARADSGRVALYFREDLPLLGPPPVRGAAEPPDSEAHRLVRERLAAGACFFTDLLVDVELAPEQLQEALWDLAWAGEVTNDAFAPLRAPRLTLARAQRDAASRDRDGSPRAAGRAPPHRSRAAGR